MRTLLILKSRLLKLILVLFAGLVRVNGKTPKVHAEKNIEHSEEGTQGGRHRVEGYRTRRETRCRVRSASKGYGFLATRKVGLFSSFSSKYLL